MSTERKRLTDDQLIAHIKNNEGNNAQMLSGTCFVITSLGREHYRKEQDGFWYLRSTKDV